MKSIYFGAIIFCLLSNCGAFEEDENFDHGNNFDDEDDIPIVEGIQVNEEKDVLILTDSNFDQIIASKPLILVDFYAPWCGHCRALEPEYEKAASLLKQTKSRVPLGKMDVTLHEETAKKYGVTKFPTLMIFQKGDMKEEYDGSQTAQGIADYMEKEATTDYKPPPSAVVTLDGDSFNSVVHSGDVVLVEFYAPWCGHCRRLEPEYERAARRLVKHRPPIVLAKVDATVEKEISEVFKVEGYPTMLIFRKGGYHYPYTGERTENGIVAFMEEEVKPPSKLVKNLKEFENNLSPRTVTIVGFFMNEQHKLFEQYVAGANLQRREYTFMHTFDEDLIRAVKGDYGMLAMYQPKRFRSKYEPERVEYTMKEDSAPEDLKTFFENNRVPLVGHRIGTNVMAYTKRYPLVVVYYDVDFSYEHLKETQRIRNEILKVANQYKGSVTFAISREDEFLPELKYLGLDDSGEDVNVGFFITGSNRYAMEPTDEFNSKVLSDFVTKVTTGIAKPMVQSVKPPLKNDGPVLIVVGLTFKDIVLSGKDGKDVLLEVYAPWCQHCKQFEPVLEKLAKDFLLSHGNSLKVAKFDSANNDIPDLPELKIEGYPTIFYVSHKSGSTKIYKYKAQTRSYNDVRQFVLSQMERVQSKDEL